MQKFGAKKYVQQAAGFEIVWTNVSERFLCLWPKLNLWAYMQTNLTKHTVVLATDVFPFSPILLYLEFSYSAETWDLNDKI